MTDAEATVMKRGDGGFGGHEQASATTIVYGPVPQPKDQAVDPHLPKLKRQRKR